MSTTSVLSRPCPDARVREGPGLRLVFDERTEAVVMSDGEELVVTLGDVYREVRTLSAQVHMATSTQESANLLRISEVKSLSDGMADHERRLRRIEAWSYGLSLTAVGLLMGVFGLVTGTIGG